MTAAMRSVSRETIGIWLLIGLLMFASIDAAADRSHAHADPASGTSATWRPSPPLRPPIAA
jgi:hypothetical protein